jgi:hypothetical protein
MDCCTFRADGRALQIDTDIVLALPFQTPGYILRLSTPCTPIEEFAADGYTHVECFCPDDTPNGQVASSHLDGTHPRAALITAPLRGVRRSIAIGKAVAAVLGKRLGRRG